MKLTKSGYIEACCEWSKAEFNFWNKDSLVRNDDGTFEYSGLVVDVWNNYYYNFPLNFCPNCGAKTEIEGGETL